MQDPVGGRWYTEDTDGLGSCQCKHRHGRGPGRADKEGTRKVPLAGDAGPLKGLTGSLAACNERKESAGRCPSQARE